VCSIVPIVTTVRGNVIVYFPRQVFSIAENTIMLFVEVTVSCVIDITLIVINKFPLSNRTVLRGIQDLGYNIKCELIRRIKL
jgi:hypothetical protein